MVGLESPGEEGRGSECGGVCFPSIFLSDAFLLLCAMVGNDGFGAALGESLQEEPPECARATAVLPDLHIFGSAGTLPLPWTAYLGRTHF